MSEDVHKGHSFEEAVAVRPISSHRYSAFLQPDWCIGTVPNGGYATAVLLSATALHFETTHGDRQSKQSHPVAVHVEFLIKTQMGPAEIVIKDVKLGRSYSVVHVSLVQEGMETIVAYITHGNMYTEQGISLPASDPLKIMPRKFADVTKLKDGKEPGWKETVVPHGNFRKAATKVRFFVPTEGQQSPSIVDQWICFADGKISNLSLGFLTDMFLTVIEQYNPDSPWSTTPSSSLPLGMSLPKNRVDKTEKSGKVAAYWYPTLVLNADFKKPVPATGLDFIFSRVVVKQIRNGRFDLDITILDESGDILVLSNHVVLIVDAQRNTSKRGIRPEKI